MLYQCIEGLRSWKLRFYLYRIAPKKLIKIGQNSIRLLNFVIRAQTPQLYNWKIEKHSYLSDCIVSLNNWKDTFTLDWRRLIKTIAVNTSKRLLFQSHIIKPINWFIPIWLQIFIICKINDMLLNKGWGYLPASSWALSSSSVFSSSLGTSFWVLYET